MRCLLNGLLNFLPNYINETITISDLSGCKTTELDGNKNKG